MAGTPFIDLDALDLNAVAISAEKVGRLNPQCGDMRQLDHVIWIDEPCTLIVGVKHVRPDEFWVEGHIPGRPLLPGVLMIEAAAQLCSILFRCKTGQERFFGFTRCNDVAFRGQVVPGQTLHLIAREISARPRRFESEAQGIVDGTMVFEGRICGMVI